MPRKVISDDLRMAVLQMDAHGEPTDKICAYTGVSLRSVQRFIQIYHETGEYRSKRSTGRRPVLSAQDLEVRQLVMTHL